MRSMPVSIVPRAHLDAWRTTDVDADLRPEALAVLAALRERGAAFAHDLARPCHLLPAQVDAALAELSHAALIHSDAFAGLRAFLLPAHKRPRRSEIRGSSIAASGRWNALPLVRETDVEIIARALLERYGVVFRRVLERESGLPSWRDLLHVYRRLEARGEVRGGRFVAGFSGEQYALPAAVSALRLSRNEPPRDHLVSIASADPLNLLGIITEGERVSSNASHRVLFRDGVPVAVVAGKHARRIDGLPLDADEARALVRRPASGIRAPSLAGPRLRSVGPAAS